MAKKKKSVHKTSTKKQVEHKEHKVKKEESVLDQLIPKNQNAWISAGIFALIGLIVGALIVYAAMPVSQTEEVCDVPGVNVVELESKVTSYLNDNLMNPDLKSQGAKFIVKDSNELENGIYSMPIYLSQDGEEQLIAITYATENNLILAQGEAIDLNEPIEQPVQPEEPTNTTVYTKSEIPKVELFIMSFCPYGLQAVQAYDEAINLLDNNIDFSMNYVVYSNYASNYGKPWEDYCLTEEENYCSMHGINELTEDVRELCIQRDQTEKFWPYMRLLYTDYQAGKVSSSNINDMWKTYAEQVGINTDAVEKCVVDDASILLAEQKELNELNGVSGSPTALINGTKYQGSRNSEAFKTSICSAFTTAPGVCVEELDSQTQATNGSC